MLTTFRRNGQPVSTPVSIAVHGGRVYFVTAMDSGKARRAARCEKVRLALCSLGGAVAGEPVDGQVRLLEGPARRQVRRVLRPTGALFWSYLLYRAQGKRLGLYEVTLGEAATD